MSFRRGSVVTSLNSDSRLPWLPTAALRRSNPLHQANPVSHAVPLLSSCLGVRSSLASTPENGLIQAA